MKRNHRTGAHTALDTLHRCLSWQESPVPGLQIASFTDQGTLDEDTCLQYLSESEKLQATQKTEAAERRHFILRRCFQRTFLASVIQWLGPVPELQLQHQRDTMPHSDDAPGLRLSFSSSGMTAIACAARHRDVGIDIERIRLVPNAAALAERFFSPREAEAIANATENAQSDLFLHMWTAKEAGLKSLGKGIDSGLNRFRVNHKDGFYAVEMSEEYETTQGWKLHYLRDPPDCIVAIIQRPVDI